MKGQDKSKEFRYQILENYKGKRPDLDQGLRDRLNLLYRYSIEYGAEPALEGLETDDMVQIYAHEFWHQNIPYTIAHIDKDLDTIPGNHYNYNKEEHYEVDLDTARRNFFYQLLVGDTADNIPGIRGIGPKKANALLDNNNPEYWYRTVRSLWSNKLDMDRSARCLFMGDPDTFTYDLRKLYAKDKLHSVQEELQGSAKDSEVLLGSVSEEGTIRETEAASEPEEVQQETESQT